MGVKKVKTSGSPSKKGTFFFPLRGGDKLFGQPSPGENGSGSLING